MDVAAHSRETLDALGRGQTVAACRRRRPLRTGEVAAICAPVPRFARTVAACRFCRAPGAIDQERLKQLLSMSSVFTYPSQSLDLKCRVSKRARQNQRSEP